ncbi:phosphorylase kinase, delta [Podila epigama]|nr:phosphorylase kinase, delta [Podila epigama]
MAPSNFTEEERNTFKESFDVFDKNSDGSINAAELRALLKIVGEQVHKTSIADVMEEFDTNKDQQIDFDEFLQLVSKYIKNKA